PMVTSQSYRNPALLAKIAAGVDQVSGGRLEFGVGAGWKAAEYKAYGYAFPDAPTRVTQLVETLEICTRMWGEPKATYRGTHYRIEEALCAPKPLQKPLPIWVGGTKPRVMRVAAKYAHWFNMSDPSNPIEPRIADLNRLLPAACKAISSSRPSGYSGTPPRNSAIGFHMQVNGTPFASTQSKRSRSYNRTSAKRTLYTRTSSCPTTPRYLKMFSAVPR